MVIYILESGIYEQRRLSNVLNKRENRRKCKNLDKINLWNDAVCTFQRKLFDIWLLCDGVTDDAIWILALK